MHASRYFIGKVGISTVDMNQTIGLIKNQIRLRKAAYICVANVRTSVLSQKKAAFCKIQNESYLTVPDGMPLVWYAKLAGYKNVNRVVGADLMTKLFELSGQYGFSHYLYGDTDETLAAIIDLINEKYPDVNIAGTYSPPFRPLSDLEVKEFVGEVNRLKPTFLWVALGAPKQEYLIVKMMDYIDQSIVIGVGAAFRFIIGEYKHPHAFIQKCGLEGVYWRFMKDPATEAKWYLYHIPAFGKLMITMLIQRMFRRQS